MGSRNNGVVKPKFWSGISKVSMPFGGKANLNCAQGVGEHNEAYYRKV